MQIKWKVSKQETIGNGVVVKCNDKFYLTSKVTAKLVYTSSGNRLNKENCKVMLAHSIIIDDDGSKVKAVPHYLTYSKLFIDEAIKTELPSYLPLKTFPVFTRLKLTDKVKINDELIKIALLDKSYTLTEEQLRSDFEVVEVINKNTFVIANAKGLQTTVKRIQVKALTTNKIWLLVY